jgi:hypothetical protein
MHLIELLLPLYDNNGNPFGSDLFDQIRNELTDLFGGITAFRRSPAEGLWQETDGKVYRDEIVVYEVMVEEFDRLWWLSYREKLESIFKQEQLVIRAIKIDLI